MIELVNEAWLLISWLKIHANFKILPCGFYPNLFCVSQIIRGDEGGKRQVFGWHLLGVEGGGSHWENGKAWNQRVL